MANTKVTGDLIASSTIATGNIADNAITSDKISGITTAHITEGSNLYYTDARADARAALLVDSAPSTLNTLNELAAALGDDPNFATTVTNSIATKLPLAGGTLTGGLTGTTAGFSGSITASGNSNSFGNTTIGALAASTGTFSASVTAAGNSNSFGNSTFAGNVGIGAAASDGNLHVRKTGVNTGITNVLMNANFADGSNGTGLSIGYRTDETTAVIAARTATGNIAFYSYDGGWSESMRIKNNGNVGIGTASPGRKLTVTGDASGDANNLLLANENDTDGDSTSIGFSMLSNNTYVKSGIFFKRTTTQGRGDLIFANNNEVNGNNVTLSDAKIIIQPGGNVGIEATSPVTKLHVKHPTAINDAYGLVLIENTNTTGSSGPTNSAVNVKNKFGTSQFMQWENEGVRIGSRILDNGGTGDIIFTAGSDQEKMRITSAGNVGIGRTSDTAKKLDVLGAGLRLMDTSSYSSITIGASGWQTTYPYQRLDTFNSDGTGYYWALGHRKTDGTKTIRMLVPDTSTRYVSVIDALYVQSFTSNELGGSGNYPSFSTNVVLRNNGVSYINGGNVGIGVTSPTNGKLEVQQTATTAALWVQTGGTTSSYTIADFRTGTNAPALAIKGDGRVGIGTTSPNAKLAVNGNLRVEGNASGTSISFGGLGDFAIDAPGVGGGRFVVKHSSGDVGIGTNSPGYKLDVAGEIRHEGLVPKDLSAGDVAFIDGKVTINKTVSTTANVWTSLDISLSNIGGTGTFVVQVYSNAHGGTGAAWYNMYWSGIMSWYHSSTNDDDIEEIPLHMAGHARNNDTLELRTKLHTADGTSYANRCELQIKTANTLSSAPISFRFRKLL